ncbi:MAG: DUF3795 domain-containing protein [Bacteroidales bacterium]|jgi:hypothetical protein
METMIAYCGLACNSCPIHLATLEKNVARQAEMRVSIAGELSRIYGTKPKPEIITDCDGCKAASGRLFTGCSGCEIRKCAIMKSMINCAYCSEYPCDRLKRHFVYDPESRKRLEDIRNKNQ